MDDERAVPGVRGKEQRGLEQRGRETRVSGQWGKENTGVPAMTSGRPRAALKPSPCPCPDPTKPSELTITLMAKAATPKEMSPDAESHQNDLSYLERVEAREALLALNAWEEMYESPFATRRVEILLFCFSREKSTKEGKSQEALKLSEIGHQDIRRVKYELVRFPSPARGVEPREWSRLSMRGEKTDIESKSESAPLSTETDDFTMSKNRAFSMITLFEQTLAGIDPTLLPRAQEKLKEIRGRVSSWQPRGGEHAAIGKLRGIIEEPDIIVNAALSKEAVTKRAKTAKPSPTEKTHETQPKEIKISFKPILFSHNQPTSPDQPKTPLTDNLLLDEAEKELNKVLGFIQNKQIPHLIFKIYGYADSTGNPDGQNWEYNKDLSIRRAAWVKNQLKQKCGNSIEEKCQIKGCGDSKAPPGGKPSAPHRAVLIQASRETPSMGDFPATASNIA